ncbi:MAG: N-acetyl-gamma-glutamyl-phosphate reductase [Myxococcaceae bacterium]|nr:N-acetyl-gamma-glutamyl-phosphate reductase [Myxococcaceae bacterium]
MQSMNIGLFGASGYSGLELLGLLARHPRVKVVFAAGDRFAGDAVAAHAGPATRALGLRFVPHAEAQARLAECDAVLLATPASASLTLAPLALAAKARVVDLSGAFRLREAGQYPKSYGLEHTAPALLARAVYGLPELGRPALDAGLVANPGCYATAAALAAAPLVRGSLVDQSNLVFTAASGTSGAGRQASEGYSFTELAQDFRAYKTLTHQHAPEIAQALGVPFVPFVAHLLPVARGLLVTLVAPTTASEAAVRAAFEGAYGKEPFIELAADANDVRLNQVVHTPVCRLGVTVVQGRVVVTAALDNLLKGAASQAVQNLNRLAGWPETLGLLPPFER